MPLREQTPTSLILTIAALALAILAGAVIAFSGGGGGAAETLSWTPPPTQVATAQRLPAETATVAPTRTPTATVAATSTPTRVPRTATPATAPSATAEAAAPAAPAARILQGPANLRSGPGREYGVSRVAKEGETYEATGQTADGAWLRLCCVNGAAAWVAGELVELPDGADLPFVKP